MPKKRFSAEQIVMVLRQIEVLMSQGESNACGLPGSGHFAAELLPVAQGVWRSRSRPGEADEGSGTGECTASPPCC